MLRARYLPAHLVALLTFGGILIIFIAMILEERHGHNNRHHYELRQLERERKEITHDYQRHIARLQQEQAHRQKQLNSLQGDEPRAQQLQQRIEEMGKEIEHIKKERDHRRERLQHRADAAQREAAANRKPDWLWLGLALLSAAGAFLLALLSWVITCALTIAAGHLVHATTTKK